MAKVFEPTGDDVQLLVKKQVDAVKRQNSGLQIKVITTRNLAIIPPGIPKM
jgi:hypothetical protein